MAVPFRLCRRLGLCAIALFAGCASPAHYFDDHPPRALIALEVMPHEIAVAELAPRAHRMFDGHRGRAVGWADLMSAVAWAEVIVLGEQHDDAAGHAVQLAVVQDALDRWPRAAVSMEMLERDEQPLVDDYLEGVIDQETFAKLTFSEGWAGEGSWQDWYQPIIDEAKEHGRPVIAANAPRRYVRLARLDGYARLRALDPARRKLFALPESRELGAYRRRFEEVMAQSDDDDDDGGDGDDPPATAPQIQPETAPAHQTDATTQAATQPTGTPPASTAPATVPATAPATSPATAPAHPLRPVDESAPISIDALFRSQLVWDATMADSILHALRAGNRKVIHLVGQFHADFDGGLVRELRHRRPRTRILVISMQPEDSPTLRAEDRGRADIVIYTGEPAPD